MTLNELFTEEKVRLDPKCWTGKKIGDPKTKVKGGVRVNNCVPAESIAEGSEESYMIIRTDAEGKQDVFAGNFDTYEQAQKELDDCLAHPLHTKYKQKFEIKRKGQQGVAEGKITLSTDPNWYGATVDNYQASGPVVNIPANQLVGFEPDDKMNQPKSKVNVEKIVAGLKQGAKLPPLLVRKYKDGYQVLDGHHRFWAYKLLGTKSIPSQIVPDKDIEEISKQGVAENNTAAGINKMFNNLGDPVFSNLQRVALLAMQGRQQEAYGRLQSVIKDASPQVQKKIIDAVNNIKPVTINGKIADSSTIDKSKQHQDWIINTFIPWVQSLLGKQGLAEKMKMGATIEPMEDKEKSDPVVDATLKFYKPVMQKASEQEVDHYVEKAKHLLQKTDDPVVRKKLIDIFKEGKHNPYLQGGIITAIAALLGGGAINLANSIQLTPYQTNLMMQGILNTIVPAVGARMSGKDWVDTLKYTLASLGVGVGIATVMEKDSDVIGHVAKDLAGPGAPIAKLRAARDAEQMKKRERSDGLPVEPKFDYLDEK